MHRTLTTIKTLILLSLLSLQASAGRKFYVSSTTTGASDANAGTTSSTPWKTIDKVNAFWSSLLAGDTIAFKSGDSFLGTITPTKGGASGSEIVVTNYGGTAKPKITSLVNVGGWTQVKPNIYTSSAISREGVVRTVIIDGKMKEMGRWPDVSDAGTDGGYLKATGSGSGNWSDNNYSTFANTQVNPMDGTHTFSWKGALYVHRVTRFNMETDTVTGQSGSTFNFSGTTLNTGWGYFFTNSMQTLNKDGEWFFDVATNKLSIYSSVDPSTRSVQVASMDNLYDNLSNKTGSRHYDYIKLENLEFSGSNGSTVQSAYSIGSTINNCLIRYGSTLIRFEYTTNAKITNSTIDQGRTFGILIKHGSSTTSANSLVQDNLLTNIGVFPAMTANGTKESVAVSVNGGSGTVQYNHVENTGYAGYVVNMCSNQVVKYNYGSNAMVTMDDGGEFYTIEQNGTTPRTNKSFTYNIVNTPNLNAWHGTPAKNSSGYVAGIYLDNTSTDVLVDHNTIIGSVMSVFLHHAVNCTISYNNIFGNNDKQMLLNTTAPKTTLSTGLNYHHNVALDTSKTAGTANGIYNGGYTISATTIGKWDYNKYFRPAGSAMNFRIDHPDGSGVSSPALSEWRSIYKWDINGSETPPVLGTRDTIVYNESKSTQTFSLGNRTWIDMDGVAYKTNSVTLAPYTSVMLINTPNVPVVSSGGNIAPTVSLTAAPASGSTYIAPATVNLTANASDADGTITKVDFYNGSTLLGTDNVAPYTFSWTNVGTGGYNLTAKATDNSTATNNMATSNTVNVTVSTKPTNPIVAITSPTNNSTYTAPATITLSADATASTGSTITKVDFYSGTTLIHTETTAPYSWAWTNVITGNYQITAVATDNNGLQTTSASVSTAVTPPVDHPSVVSITSPANNSTYTATAAINITASATDAEGVKSVAFYSGATLLGSDITAPYTYSWTGIGAGNYNISAKVTDSAGNTTSSNAVSISVTDPVVLNKPPTVSLTAPTSASSFTAPATVVISANAADADGTITKVNFYAGPTLLYSDIAAPYTYTWSNVAAGGYSITAVATDNSGANTTSGAVSINVASTPPPSNIPPVVVIDTPFNNSSYIAPANIPLYATASDPDGVVDSVAFYNGNTLIFTEVITPWQRTWKNVPAGIYNLTAKAYDHAGAVTTSLPVKVTVGTPPKAPKVALTSPVNNSSYTAPADIVISATATDSDGTISKVDFYNGTTLLFSDVTSPYTYTWPKVAAGNYNLTAKATDNANLVTTSGSISVTVKAPVNKLPTISLTSPTNNSTFQAPTNVVIAATANDSDGTVSKVDFYEGGTLLGTDITAPYSYTWNSTPAGTYMVTAVVTDNSGAQTTSGSRTFNVLPVNLPPTVAITTPLNNTIVTANGAAFITIKVDADDPDGSVDTVKIFANGTLIYTGLDSPFTVLNSFNAGTYTLTATARDDKGVITTSAPVSLTIKSAVAPNVTVAATATALTSPATISGSATASDPDGTIVRVEFYLNNSLVGTDLSSPYTFSIANQPAGIYQLTAKATDNSNLATTSSPVAITVTNPRVPPTVSVTSPIANATYKDPAEVSLSANAADADGTIKSVSFYQGTTLIGTDTAAPYSLVWSSVMAGSYSITARATDNDGLITTSSPVSITVTHVNQPPTVYWTSPLNGDAAPNKGGFNLNVVPTDPDGTIAKVQFYINGSLLATILKAPYSITTSNMKVGTYTFTAVVTDDKGATGQASIDVRVVSSKSITVYGMKAVIVP